MREEVVVNTTIAKYMPEFHNPIYEAAKRVELINQIKDGNFLSLYPILIQLDLREREILDIASSWLIKQNYLCISLYYDHLLNKDYLTIRDMDEIYDHLINENGQIKRK